EKRYIGFAGYGPRQQGLACSRMAYQQNALRNASTELLKLLCLAQELDDLAQLFLCLVHAGHVLESDLFLLHGEQPRPALAETQGLVAAGLHLTDHHKPEDAQQQER